MAILNNRIEEWSLVENSSSEEVKERCKMRITELSLIKELIVENNLQDIAYTER
jgi:hypothetical protein